MWCLCHGLARRFTLCRASNRVRSFFLGAGSKDTDWPGTGRDRHAHRRGEPAIAFGDQAGVAARLIGLASGTEDRRSRPARGGSSAVATRACDALAHSRRKVRARRSQPSGRLLDRKPSLAGRAGNRNRRERCTRRAVRSRLSVTPDGLPGGGSASIEILHSGDSCQFEYRKRAGEADSRAPDRLPQQEQYLRCLDATPVRAADSRSCRLRCEFDAAGCARFR